MEFCGVAVGFGQFGDMHVVVFVSVGCGVQFFQFERVCCICCGSRL